LGVVVRGLAGEGNFGAEGGVEECALRGCVSWGF
jgi:hypothetical protein